MVPFFIIFYFNFFLLHLTFKPLRLSIRLVVYPSILPSSSLPEKRNFSNQRQRIHGEVKALASK